MGLLCRPWLQCVACACEWLVWYRKGLLGPLFLLLYNFRSASLDDFLDCFEWDTNTDTSTLSLYLSLYLFQGLLEASPPSLSLSASYTIGLHLTLPRPTNQPIHSTSNDSTLPYANTAKPPASKCPPPNLALPSPTSSFSLHRVTQQLHPPPCPLPTAPPTSSIRSAQSINSVLLQRRLERRQTPPRYGG